MANIADTYLVLNSIVAQSEGKNSISEVNITDTASFGKKLLSSELESSKDVVFKALIDRIGKTVIDMLEYDNKFAKIFKDAFAYGSVLQTIHVANMSAKKSGVYDNLDNGDVDGELYKMFLPSVDQTLFENVQPWEFAVTITDKQIESAFISPEGVAGFINGIFIAIKNSITKYLETCARTCYENLIVADFNYASKPLAINVLQRYYDETGIVLTVDNFQYNADFNRWLTSVFTDYVGLFEEMTVCFNHKGYETFTPKSGCHLVVNNKVADNIKRFMTSNVYNDELVSMPYYDEVSSWQGIGTTPTFKDRLKVYAKFANPDYEEGGSEPQYLSTNKYIIAVMHDDRVLSLTLKDRRTVSIPNEHGARRNVFEQGVVCNFVNLGHNSLVFYVDEVLESVDIDLDKHKASVVEDSTVTLTATTNPDDAVVTWSSSNTSVATVSSGVVTGEGAGTCIITAYFTDATSGETVSDTCAVTVTAKT